MKLALLFTFGLVYATGCNSLSPTAIKGSYLSSESLPSTASTYMKTMGCLRNLKGRNLLGLPKNEQEQIRSSIEKIRPSKLCPAYICELRDHKGGSKIVYVEGDESHKIPSRALVKITTFDPKGLMRPESCEFSAGWRNFITGFEVFTNRVNDFGDLLVIKTGSGTECLKEYYGLCSESLLDVVLLIRLEASDGSVVDDKNVYGFRFSNQTIGPLSFDSEAFSMEDWERVFSSGSPVVVQSGLLYLQGRHIREEKEQSQYVSAEEVVRELVKRGTDKVLLKHSSSWIREAAKSLFEKYPDRAVPEK